jgi:uncharacterized protein (DUF111 family)
LDRLFALGARDAHLLPAQMKKNRPGVSLQVLVDVERASAIIETILRESSTFGVKVAEVDRYCLPRRMETVETRYGAIDVKVGEWGGQIVKVKPEFDSCRRRAEEAGVSLPRVYLHAAEAIAAKYAHSASGVD